MKTRWENNLFPTRATQGRFASGLRRETPAGDSSSCASADILTRITSRCFFTPCGRTWTR
jgi:hypothetical protein